MEEIKVGEYVRSLVNGEISKVLEVSDLLEEPNIKYYKTGKFTGFCLTEYYNVKHSSNIIDLIEIGDYVNGSKVVAEKYKNYDMNFIYVDSKISFGWGYGVIPENDIKSIVTKEKFEKESYRGEE